MKKAIQMIVAVFVAVFSINARSVLATEETFSVDYKIDAQSNDVNQFTGQVNDRIIVHPMVTITHNPSKIYISTIAYITKKFEETDFCVGKTFKVADISFDVGAGYYGVNADEDFAALYVSIRFPEFQEIIPFVYVESEYGLSGGRGGVLWNFGAERSFNIWNADYLLKAEFGGSDGIYATKPKLVAFGRLNVSTEVSWLGLNFVPSISLQKGTDEDGIAGDEVSLYGTLTWMF